METKYYQVCATLVRANENDLVENEIFVEDKAFFLKNTETGCFESLYILNAINCFYTSNKDNQQQVVDFQINEIRTLIKKGMLYKIGILNLQSMLSLVVRKATVFDLFVGNFLKLNTIYYTIGGFSNATEGPFYINENDSPQKINDLIQKGKIYVLAKTQTFHIISNQLSA